MWKKLLLTSFIMFGMLSFSHAASVGDYKDFGYTGGVQSYTVPADGVYKLEVWGAQGSDSRANGNNSGDTDHYGGKGGYATGTVTLTKGQTLYIVVGGAGSGGGWYASNGYGGYNNGGNGCAGSEGSWGFCNGQGGGGATHIAKVSGTLTEIGKTSFDTNGLIVAGGGGGASYYDAAGSSNDSEDQTQNGGAGGGTSTNGVFGQGSGGSCSRYNTGGGGGGYYGGSVRQGGSSWTHSSLSNVTTTAGQRSGNGYAKITIMSVIQTLTCPSASNKTYNGSSQTGMSCPTGSTASGCSATDAGSYRCTCTAKSGYTFNGNCYRDWTIGKANPKVTAPTAKTLTYNKSNQNLINAGSTTGGTIQYKVNNGAYSTSIPVGTNAGTYTVYYKVVGNKNYNDIAEKSITVSIAKASVTIPSLSDTDKTYNGNSQSPTFNNRDSDKVGQSGTASATDAGTHTITWNLLDPNNYNWSDGTTKNKSANWTIARAKTATASASDKNYNGEEQTGVSGNYVTWTGTTKATVPNLYTATATPDSNHAWSDGSTSAKNLTWSILQNWNRYKIDCVTDSAGKIVQPTDAVKSDESYTIKNLTFDIKAQDANLYAFCVGKNRSESVVYYNGEQSGIYYWKNGAWTKK